MKGEFGERVTTLILSFESMDWAIAMVNPRIGEHSG